jgi:hypothetical protein
MRAGYAGLTAALRPARGQQTDDLPYTAIDANSPTFTFLVYAITQLFRHLEYSLFDLQSQVTFRIQSHMRNHLRRLPFSMQ